MIRAEPLKEGTMSEPTLEEIKGRDAKCTSLEEIHTDEIRVWFAEIRQAFVDRRTLLSHCDEQAAEIERLRAAAKAVLDYLYVFGAENPRELGRLADLCNALDAALRGEGGE